MNTLSKTNLFLTMSLTAFIFFNSCKPSTNDDITETVNKNGSVESAIQILHIDSASDELVTTHSVWVKNNLVKSIIQRDTIPALGKEKLKLTNENGNEELVEKNKAYEIFITIK